MNDSKPLPMISCVVPVFNEGGHIATFLQQLDKVLQDISPEYEIIVVDDGSEDNSVDEIISLRSSLSAIKLIQFSRNFGKEAALTAGIDHVVGDATILIDSDFQHPFELIPKMVKYWQEGYEIVHGVRRSRKGESLANRLFSHLFYKIMRASDGVKITPNAGDFRLMDRQVIEAIKKLPERNRFMKGMYAWVGFDSKAIEFDADVRVGGTPMSLRKRSRLALTGLVSYSSLPLKLVGLLGILVAMISMIYGIYIIVETLVFGNENEGWPTLVVIISFLSGVQLFAIGVMGEYISGIFSEVKKRTIYIVREERHSEKEHADNSFEVK